MCVMQLIYNRSEQGAIELDCIYYLDNEHVILAIECASSRFKLTDMQLNHYLVP